nr:LTA synthase family protein [Butyrivibrio sp.]
LSSWDELSLEEVIYQLSMPLEGTSSAMLVSFVYCSILPTLAVVFFVGLAIFILKKKIKPQLCLNVLTVASLLVLILDVAIVWKSLNISSYFADNSYDFIKEEYVNPNSVKITFPEQKRNLIYLYLESMETTYTTQENGGAYEYNLIPELVDIARENDDFSGDSDLINGGLVLPGSGWTSGAMFASSSGLPLKIPIGENEMRDMTSFFPRVETLGDILEDEGYYNELMIGSEAVFGGRNLYYMTHGNFQISDYTYAIENHLIPEDYYVWWGYEDQKLFAFAKDELTRLGQGSQPFNLTLLTVDTHFTDGYVCELCEDTYDSQYANVIACSSKQVKDFISWIQEQDWYENTTIVIHGDHTTMDSNFLNDIDPDYQRKVFVSYVNSAATLSDTSRRDYSTMDLFPTTLSALGCKIEGDRLGLGTNLYSDKKTLTEIYGISEESKLLAAKSDFMTFLAAVPDDVITNSAANQTQPTGDVAIAENADGSITISVTNIEKNNREVEEAIVIIDDTSYYMQKGNKNTFSLTLDKSNLPENYRILVNLIDYNGTEFTIYDSKAE